MNRTRLVAKDLSNAQMKLIAQKLDLQFSWIFCYFENKWLWIGFKDLALDDLDRMESIGLYGEVSSDPYNGYAINLVQKSEQLAAA